MRVYATILLIFRISFLFGQGLIDLPIGFKDSAYNHVRHLTSFGIRNATQPKGETGTLKYLDNYFASLDLKTIVDTFNFKCFDTKDLNVYCGDSKLNFKTIYINPYKDSAGINGFIYLFRRDWGYNSINPDSIFDKIILTQEVSNVYLLYEYKPRAIVILNDSDLFKFNKDIRTCSIRFKGNINDYKSYNIYCSLDNKKAKEILIGAHWDSSNDPGADDNASGVSVVLELARFFNNRKEELPFNIKFVLFGGEELGLLGSKAYTQKHIKDTSSTIYYFNIDCVGDTGETIADMNRGITYKGQPYFYSKDLNAIACNDFKGQWQLIDLLSIPDDSNVPQWFQNILINVLDSTHHKYEKSNGIGSDHRSFGLMGFAATHIGFNGNNVQHCPEDNINQVNKNSLELAGRIVATTVMKTSEIIKK